MLTFAAGTKKRNGELFVVTPPLPWDGGTEWIAIQNHAVNLIEIRLGERWQPISNQSWVTGSPTTNKVDCHWWAPKSCPTYWVSNFTIVIRWSMGRPPVCHIKVEASSKVPCPRTQQANLSACSLHHPFLMLSANQGSCEYHFLKSSGMTWLREWTPGLPTAMRTLSPLHHRAG